ncbi:hypothetical protein EG832_07270, partial [bacterium]|nr:hypothetical protein [bacterium]
YKTILHIVRIKCRRDSRPFHVFQVLGLQLRAASCLPALADEIRAGRFGETGNLFDEAVGDMVVGDLFDGDLTEEFSSDGIERLMSFDFEENDSKYDKLRNMLLDVVPDEKAVIFAYYRPTLAYLKRRLSDDGISVTVIHGGIHNEQRWVEIERFKDVRGPRILLSSEVGSEGIDLQFCRVLVNYDLPWNPMRVEQRIGRIDRVGQQAKRLSIVNFKVKDTVEERLYDRLHSKLARFANSLGDLESVIGKEVQQLTLELLSKDLTPEQEVILMEQAERVIEDRLLQMQALEESGDALIALSDYVQRKVEEDKEKGRYLQPDEMEEYLADFFEREFRGCEVFYNTPASGCQKIRLSSEAQRSLNKFIEDDRSLSARPLRQREFSITFRREIFQKLPASQRKIVNFVNHLSPLVRWVTSINKTGAHKFFDVSSLIISHTDLLAGDYCYFIERWRLKGLVSRERLAYGIQPITGSERYSDSQAETVVQELLRNGKDWDYVDCDTDLLLRAYDKIESNLSLRFSAAVEEFDAENGTAHHIKAQRVKTVFSRRIAQDEQRLQTMLNAGREANIIRLAEGRLRVAKENMAQRLGELDEKAKIDIEQTPIAAGIFRVA